MILLSILIFFFCIYYDKLLGIFFNKKNSRNFVAATHAYFSVILHSTCMVIDFNCFNHNLSHSILNFAYCFSAGYFLFDFYYIVKYERLNILRGMFLYHHFATIYLLLNNQLYDNTSQLILLAEISNLPSYIIYYYLHEENYSKNNSKSNIIINFTKIVQKVLYTFIRLFLNTIILINMIYKLDFDNLNLLILSGIIFPVYIMGILWTTVLVLN